MGERYFGPEEVQALIPALTEIMKGVRAAHAEATEIREALQGEQERIALAGGGVPDREAWRTGRERLERAAARLKAGLDEILKLGGVPKDLEMGLVDFPHLREGRVVNLCWKHGEREVRYWHGLAEGYAGRKPL